MYGLLILLFLIRIPSGYSVIFTVGSVVITNRQGYFCCEDSMAPETQVLVDNVLCQSLTAALTGPTVIFTCSPPLVGSVIKILAPGSSRYLNLVEVQVFSPNSTVLLPISSCTTSNQYEGYNCNGCFDGLFTAQQSLCNAASDHNLVANPFFTFTLAAVPVTTAASVTTKAPITTAAVTVTTTSKPVSGNINFCGAATWATVSCASPCPSGQNSDCPSGQTCYAAPGSCGTNVPTNQPVTTVVPITTTVAVSTTHVGTTSAATTNASTNTFPVPTTTTTKSCAGNIFFPLIISFLYFYTY